MIGPMWRFGLALAILIAPIAALAQIAPTSAAPGVGAKQVETRGFRYARVLRVGMSGTDVKALQEALLSIPNTYDSEATGYFGKLTEDAVKRFQERENIARSSTPGYGQVGPKTAAKINEMLGKRVPSTSAPVSSAPQAASSTPKSTASTSSTPITQTNKSATTPSKDTTPPVRSGGFPSNVISATTTIIISLATNEWARCYWSNTPGTPYEFMTTALKAPKGTLHTHTLWSVSPGNYAFFVKCQDSAQNMNAGDYPILFSIEYGESGGDKHPPRVVMSAPTEGESVVEGLTTLSAAASDNRGVTGVRFFLNSQDLKFEDPSSPFSVAVMLTPGTYRVFAIAHDLAGNRATSTEVSFTITKKPTMASQSQGALSALKVNLASAIDAFLGAFESLTSLFSLRSW